MSSEIIKKDEAFRRNTAITARSDLDKLLLKIKPVPPKEIRESLDKYHDALSETDLPIEDICNELTKATKNSLKRIQKKSPRSRFKPQLLQRLDVYNKIMENGTPTLPRAAEIFNASKNNQAQRKQPHRKKNP